MAGYTQLTVDYYPEPGGRLQSKAYHDVTEAEAQKLAMEAIAKHPSVQITWYDSNKVKASRKQD